ncbi:nuclear cap binding protein [Cyclospora cayetanensis]|uniref:Nuclear cap binding protein n=1 Tax=Cyclospora cayetanensis TaxID=88456 RepID=A0A1D3D6Q9_9EIME|nr:nuclear cap binding protein [Cyclospora cayetanensis]
MLRFSFDGDDARKESVFRVYQLLLSLLGKHKSKGSPAASRKTAQEEEEQHAGAEAADGASSTMETDAPEGTAAANGLCSPSDRKADSEVARDSSTREELEPEAAAEDAQRLNTSVLHHCEKDMESDPWKLEEILKLFVFCLLSFGSKTQTHLNRLLRNYAEVFLLFAQGAEAHTMDSLEDMQMPVEASERGDIYPAVLQAVQKYWAFSQQKLALTLHAFLKVGILKRQRVLQLLCEANTETRDSWAYLELIEAVLRGAVDECETAREEAAATGASKPTYTEAEELLHFYLMHLLKDLRVEEAPPRIRFLYLRCLFIGRKYAEFVDVPRLKEEVEGIEDADSRISNLLTIVEEVQKKFCFKELPQCSQQEETLRFVHFYMLLYGLSGNTHPSTNLEEYQGEVQSLLDSSRPREGWSLWL